MLNFFILFISLFVISCTQHKIIKKHEKITFSKAKDNKEGNIYIFYEDFSKESLLLDTLSKKFTSLSYKVVNIPTSQLNLFKNYYEDNNNILLSLGSTLYKLKKILNYNYKYLIIDTPSVKGKIPKNLYTNKTLIITDAKSIKYLYPILNNKNYRIDLKFDKFAWFLNENNSLKEILEFDTESSSAQVIKNSKLLFEQKGNIINFNKHLDNNLLIIFTRKLSMLKKCNKTCKIDKNNFVTSVYIPINKPYNISKEYINRSIIIKKIFELINKKEYLNAYLLLNENKKIINYKKSKKIFDFIKEPLYNSEPHLIKER